MKDILSPAIAVLQRRTIGTMEYARTIELPDGDMAGTLYDPSRHQAQECILRALDLGASWCAILKPVQDGGSLVSFAPILRRAHALSQTAIIAYPTMDSAKDAWSKKVWPMLERQGGTQPKKGGGSRGGAARVVNLPSGGSIILRAAGGRQESGQASVTADAMLVDEVDDWADLRVLRLIERRLSRSRDPLIIYISTCKRDADEGVDRSRIIRLWEQGTRTRLHYQCPHCADRFPFEWELVDTNTCTMACPKCGAVLTDADRVAMLKTWKRVDGQASHKFSIMWTALESPFPMLIDGRKMPVLHALCDEYRQAKESADKGGDHGPMRQFYRDRLCRPYNGDTEEGDIPQTLDMGLAARTTKSTHQRKEIPQAATVVSIGADVGKREAWFMSLAMDDDLRWWIVDWSVRTTADARGEPTPDDQIGVLDRLRERAAEVGRADTMGIDVGFNTDLVVPWAKRNGFRCVRGDTRPSGDKDDTGSPVSWAQIRRQKDGSVGGTPWIFIDGAMVKAEIHKSLARAPGEPGAGHLPVGQEAGDWLIRHITSEVYDAKHQCWVKKPGRDNHLLDCLVYAWALAVLKVKAPKIQAQKIDLPIMHLGGLAL